MVKFSGGDKQRTGEVPPQTKEQRQAVKEREAKIGEYREGRAQRSKDTQRKVILGACLQRLIVLGDKQALAVYRKIVPEMVDERRRKLFDE